MLVASVKAMILAALMASLLGSPSAAVGRVQLFDTDNYIKDQSVLDISYDPALHCFSFACRSRWWSSMMCGAMPKESLVAFFEEPDCKGKSLTGHGPDGRLSIKGTNMEGVTSFMLWVYGMYPTRGFEDMCTDDMWAERVTLNHTLKLENEIGE